jgi:hypothetical protein
MRTIAPRRRGGPSAIRAALLALLLAGCTVRFVADYDAETERAVTAVYSEVDGFLIDLERHMPAWDSAEMGPHRLERGSPAAVYDSFRKDVDLLLLRNRARPKNEITVQQLEGLRKSVDGLEALHRSGLTNREALETVRVGIESQCAAILRLELAKKRGEPAGE